MQENTVAKQIIIRLYGSPLDKLKEIMLSLDEREGITPELFAKDNEYIVVINAETKGEAAATEICESAALLVEKTFGEDVYGRGENTLAHAAAGALIKNGSQFCVANEELGLLLEEEFKSTKRAEHIYDFGEFTYRNSRKKIELSRKILKESGEASPAGAAALAAMAKSAARVRYGAALTKPDADGRRWIAVVDKSKTYARQLQADESARAGALAVLDLMRRLAQKPDIYSKTAPVKEKARVHASAIAAAAAGISLAAAVLLAGGAYFAYEELYVPNMPKEEVLQIFR